MREIVTVFQVETDGVQHTLRQLLGAIHRDLPGTVFQARIAETGDQQVGVTDQISFFRHVQRRRLFTGHQREGRVTVVGIGHGFVDMLVTAQITEVGQEGVAAVQHAQFHVFVRDNVFHQLCTGNRPVRVTGNEVIFDNPLTEGFGGDTATVGHTQQFFYVCQCFRGSSRHDTVNHGARESHVGFDPVSQFFIQQIDITQHRTTGNMTVFRYVIAGQHRECRQTTVTAQFKSLNQIADGRFRGLRISQVMHDQCIVLV